jgi:hypothetical protein
MSCWKVNLSPKCLLENRQPGFPLGLCLAILLIFILKNSLVLADDNHIHNMMTPPRFKIWRVVLGDVLVLPQTEHLVFRTKLIYINIYIYIFCHFTLLPFCKQDACFGIFFSVVFPFTLSIRLVLCSNDNVVDPQFSPITAIKHPPTVLKSPLASWWNPRAVSFLSGYWVRKDACIFVVIGCRKATSPCSKGYSMSALLGEALENLPGFCG